MKNLINPFHNLPSGAAIVWGTANLVAMSVIAWYSGITFRGVVSEGIGELSLWQLILQQVAGWCVFAGLLYVAARLFSKSKIRVVDMFGNQLLARMPLLLVLIGASVSPIREMTDQLMDITPNQLNANPEILGSIDMALLTAFGLAALAVLVWFFVWSYQAYAMSANLKGYKAAVSFIVCYLLAELLASWCTATIGSW